MNQSKYINKIICGDAYNVLKSLPTESVNCCISSPPYWALRDYGVDGQLGLEKTFEEYIEKLATIYDEVKRVLRKDGTCFVNLGDTYHNATKWTYTDGAQTISGGNPRDLKTGRKENQGLPEKCLCLIPDRFRIAMVDRGWIIRNKIVWHKPNPMPSSAKDRFTVDFEDVIFMVKSKKYFFEPQYEEHSRDWTNSGGSMYHPEKFPVGSAQHRGGKNPPQMNPLGRNKRCVWTIPTQPFPEAHFATYPEKLVEPMIEAGCPKYVCSKCGTPRKKVYESNYIPNPKGGYIYAHRGHQLARDDQKKPSMLKENLFQGYSDCPCRFASHNEAAGAGSKFVPGIVLDPFAGAATTLYVAAKLKRDYIGIELKQEYIDNIAMPRLREAETGVPVKEANMGQGALFG